MNAAVGGSSFLYEQKKLRGQFIALAILSGMSITVVFLLRKNLSSVE
jgi:hypothetical protein